MNVRVVSRSGDKNHALTPENVIVVCSGMYRFDDSKSYAMDHTKMTDEPTWIYEVDLTCVGVYKVEKAVTFVPAKP